MSVTHRHPAHALRRDGRLVLRSLTDFAFPISPRFRRGLVGALSVCVLLVWGAWVPSRSHAATHDAGAPLTRQA